jgi:hypothetical protein
MKKDDWLTKSEWRRAVLLSFSAVGIQFSKSYNQWEARASARRNPSNTAVE